MLKFSGITTALITPFYKGAVDYVSLKKIIQLQLEAGIKGFVINGTTAESPSLSIQEVEKIFSFIKSEVAGEVPLVLGAGSNSTKLSDKKIKQAKAWGADAVLLVCPYYNNPSQKGMVKHFQYLAQANLDSSIILYNVPSRTIVSLDLDSLKILSTEKNIIGIKEASGDIFLAKQIKKNKLFFNLLSGDDSSFLDFLQAGGNGLVGVASHILTKPLVNIFSAIANQEVNNAVKQFTQYEPLIKSLYEESNPVGIKQALFLMGIIKSAELRLPLVEAENLNINKELKLAGLF